MQKRLLLIVFLCCFFSINKVEASHPIGAEIEYESIGPRIWKIRLTVYRDCNAVQLCTSLGNCRQSVTASPNINLNPAGCLANPNNINVNLQLVKLEDLNKSVTDLCGNIAKNGCTNLGQVMAGPYNPSIEKYVFEGNLDLSTPSLNNTNCSYWDIRWDFCCRQLGIWNIDNSSELEYSVRATINIFNRTNFPVKNNSPILKNEPVLVTCSGQEQIINAGATDPDGDSLTYELGPPFASASANQIVNYRYPGSPVYPFPLNANKAPHTNYPQPNGPYVIIDNTNGDISFNAANNTSSTIFGNLNIFIKQWSYDTVGNPILVGITMRDFQYYTMNCPNNNPPQLRTTPSLPNNKPKYNFEVEAGQQLCFIVTAKDTDVYPATSRFDTTFISWNEGIVRPGKLSFAPTYAVGAGLPRPREDQWQFCWQTEATDIRTLPYYFTITAVDKFCPTIGQVTKAFSVQVIPPTPIASFTKLASNLNCGRYKYSVYKNAPYTWLHQASLKITTKPNDKNFTNNIINVAPISINPQAGMFDSIGEPRLMFTDSFQFNQSGKYYLLFSYNTTSNPSKAVQVLDSIVVPYDSLVTSIIFTNNNTSFCAGDSAVLSVNFINPRYRYQWQVNNNNILQAKANTFNAKTQGLYRVIITDTISQCQNISNGININVKPRVSINPFIKISDSCLFNRNRILFYDSSYISSGTFAREWHFGDGSKTNEISGSKSYQTYGNTEVKLVVVSDSGCTDSITLPVQISPPNKVIIRAIPDSALCEGEPLLLSADTFMNANYYWLKNNIIHSSDNTPETYIRQKGNYRLVVDLGNGCYDSSNVIIPQFYNTPGVGFTVNNPTQCINNNQFILVDTTSSTTDTIVRKWTWGNNTSNQKNLNLVFSQSGVIPITLIVITNHGCSDTLTKILTINDQPEIDSISGLDQVTSTQVVYHYQVKQQQDYTYFWDAKNGNILSGQGSSKVGIQWNQVGNHTITAISTNTAECKDTSTKQVIVSILTPYITSFTPQTGTHGTVVTIYGNHFNGTSAVRFGGINAANYKVISPSEIIATVDSGATGDVSVITQNGEVQLGIFKYNQKKITTEIGSQWFSVFPNPATIKLNIESNQTLESTTFELIDINGKQVGLYQYNSPIKKAELDISNLSNAVYLLRITSHGQTSTVKVVKQ